MSPIVKQKYSITLRDTAMEEFKIFEATLLNLSPCAAQRYRGSAHRARGLKRPAKARAKSPPLSGGEVARKTEEKGRGLSERSEFRRPRRRLRRRTQKPDNSGGASWFVLLAVEKNEQITQISVTRTFFGRERKSFVAQSSLAVPHSMAGCFYTEKYRGRGG